MTIKHISLDMWNTLIKPNPEFAKARNELVARKLGSDVETVKKAYASSKKNFDRLALQYGMGITPNRAWEHLIPLVNPAKQADFEYLSLELIAYVSALFMEHPPLMSNETIDALLAVRQAGFTLSIASNTNFNSGSGLMMWMKHDLKLPEKLFSFQLYSDLLGYAKPHWQFFQKVVNLVDVEANEILHIGDDWRYDSGALHLGIRFRSITNPDQVSIILNNLVNGASK